MADVFRHERPQTIKMWAVNCYIRFTREKLMSSDTTPPSKHETLVQCCFYVGPTSKTVGQHQNNIGSMEVNVSCLLGWLVFSHERPQTIKMWAVDCYIRLTREKIMSSDTTHPSKHETLGRCCFDVGPTSKTVGQHQNNIGSMEVNVSCLLGWLMSSF